MKRRTINALGTRYSGLGNSGGGMELRLEDVVRPEMLRYIAQVNEFIADLKANPHKLDRAKQHYEDAGIYHYELVRRYENLYVVDLLTPEGAEYFLHTGDLHANLFATNDEEGTAYQIPEIVLKSHPVLQEQSILAERIGREVLWPLFHLMYGNAPNKFSAVQLARYSSPDNLGTGWHCDESSEASCVVSLAPERHTGGGTLLMPHGVFSPQFYLPPLLKGQALLFNGRTTLHRGLELSSGERNLLVYWMTNYHPYVGTGL